MGTTRFTHGIPRWAWHAVSALVLLAVVATLAVTGPSSGPDGPSGTNPTPQPEIVGGRPAGPTEYPFAVALLRRGTSDRFDAQFCGGSLIGPDLVLTAAHCVFGRSASTVDVLAGTHDLRSGGQRLHATRIHVHPAFDPDTTANDVAVVETAAFVRGASLLSVATPDDEPAAPGSPSTVIGWGSTKTNGYPTSLRTVEVPVVSDESCRASYGRQIVEAVMICAGEDDGGRDSCNGDSGGPLMVRRDESWLQIGIVSWGYGCALPGLPGVYAETAATSPFLAPFVTGLRDLPPWSAEAITWLTSNGYADGYPDRLFRPDEPLTRAQSVQMLHRIIDPPDEATTDSGHGFADVPPWVDEAVRWAAHDPDGDGPASAPMSGYADRTFRPDAPMTRGAFSRLLWRLAGSPAPTTEAALADLGPWVADAAAWMIEHGHATGWPDGTYRPLAPVTRAQAARMLARIHQGPAAP